MKIRKIFQTCLLQEDLNFLLTNRIPRITLTRFMGWWSQLRHPWIVKGSIAVWRGFTDLDLSESKQQKFSSLHECFTRELRPGLRPIHLDPCVMTSPCDAIIGACGKIHDGLVFQAKGFPYTLESLLSSAELIQHWPGLLEGGQFITMRLTSSMYHRFHAPCDARLNHVTYISGDTWNVNPIALTRVKELFCKNERALLSLSIGEQGYPIALVPVAAILVASIRLHGLNMLFHPRYQGQTRFACHVEFEKGEELGWFEHGSTIIVFAPAGFKLAEQIAPGVRIQMGTPLMYLPEQPSPNDQHNCAQIQDVSSDAFNKSRL